MLLHCPFFKANHLSRKTDEGRGYTNHAAHKLAQIFLYMGQADAKTPGYSFWNDTLSTRSLAGQSPRPEWVELYSNISAPPLCWPHIYIKLQKKRFTKSAKTSHVGMHFQQKTLPQKPTKQATMHTHRKVCTDYLHITARCIYRVPTIPTSFQPHPSNDVYMYVYP